MKRNQITYVAAMLLFGFFALALSVQSVADDKKDPKEVAKDVKFACSRHGPAHMQLTFSHEAGKGRKIEILGKNDNGAKWFVTIDGTPAANGNGGKSGDTVKVHSGDTITWTI